MDLAIPDLDDTVRAAIARAPAEAALRGQAERAWQEQRLQSPNEMQALRGFIRWLRTEHHTDAARVLAVDLAALPADNVAVPVMAAELLARLGDHGEALRIALTIERRFPKSPQGPRLHVAALAALGLEQEASALLAGLPEEFGAKAWAVRARAVPAPESPPLPPPQGAPDAASLVAEAQSLLSQNRLDDAAESLAACLRYYPGSMAALRLQATLAERRGEMDEALRVWGLLRERAPRSAAGYVGALRTLRRFNRLDLAVPVLTAGRENLWDHAGFVLLAAQVAAAAKMVGQADQWWQRATALMPENPAHALSAATVLSGPRKGRLQRMPTVLARLEAHHARFPDYVPAYAAHIDALRNSGQPEEAERLSAAWCSRFPDDLDLALARAGLHEEQGLFDRALTDLAALRARAPYSVELEVAFIRATSCAGQHDEADALCGQARQAAPRERRFWLEYARIASRRGDWDLCASRLREALAVMPGDDPLLRELQTVRLQLAEPEPPDERAGMPENLFARFESLGGSGMGCEFGMVQRKLGCDTVGLLRWARTNAPELIAALQQDFAGVGDEANTELTTVRLDVDREEYVTRDTRYLMESHTFVRTADAPADRMFAQTCRRLRFLRGKFLEDVSAAEKIFVYRAQDPIDDATMSTMHAALARHGDVALLCVMRAPEGVAGGALRVVSRGIYVGYVRYFARDESGGAGSDIESWSALCAKADAAWRGAKPEAPPPDQSGD